MVTTNDKNNSLMAHEQKTQKKKHFWLDTSLLPWWKKAVMYPQNDVHTSEDILTKMIKKFPLTLNFFWVVYMYVTRKDDTLDSRWEEYVHEVHEVEKYSMEFAKCFFEKQR